VRFILDENLSPRTSEQLRLGAYDAIHAKEVVLTGASDEEVLQHARQEQRFLITQDKWFADRHANPLGSHAGVILLRLKDSSPDSVGALLRALLPRIDDLPPGSLVVANERRYRIRRP
jgi:predicted nuclease of predicted toxin-antitoxin system